MRYSWHLRRPRASPRATGRHASRRRYEVRPGAARRGNFMQIDASAAIVTGAASGLGLATARMLALQGARVALLDIDAARVAEAAAGLGDAGPRPAMRRRRRGERRASGGPGGRRAWAPAHPGELRRHCHRQTHRRARRAHAARRVRARDPGQPDRHVQPVAPGGRRDERSSSPIRKASAAPSSTPPRSPRSMARSARRPMPHRRAGLRR